MNCVEKYHASIAERNARLKALADTMKSYSDTSGDHHWQAAMEIERLLMIENLYLVSGRYRGDDDDTVRIIEDGAMERFCDELGSQGDDDSAVYIIHESRLGNSIDQRLKVEVEDAN